MEPLEGLDAAFLALETGTSHLQVGAVLVLDPPEGRRSLFSPNTRFAQIRNLFEQRIHLVPPFRQRAVRVPLGLHHPVWVDDPAFDLDDHIRRGSLPQPGGSRELDELVADFMARALDPERPLWEMVVVEGLSGGRTAIVAKLHHAILDGVSGASLMAAFMDLGPRARPVPMAEEHWSPAPVPGAGALLRYAASSMVRQPEVAVGALKRGMGVMVEVAGQNRRLAEQGEVPPPAPFSAPKTSINGNLSSRRRFATFSVPAEDVKLVRRTLGVSVNDVILAGVGGALSRLLARRGELPEKALVAMVPVSTRRRQVRRGEASGVDLGNKLSGMLVSLASTVEDPIERLLAISEGSRLAKVQERLTGGTLLEDVAQMAPPAVASRAMRWASGLGVFDRFSPPFNLTVSSVPGPDVPIWCAGSRIAELYPIGPVVDGVGLNVTAMTYLGSVHFGLLGCRKLVPDVQDLAILIDDALGELAMAALRFQGAVG